MAVAKRKSPRKNRSARAERGLAVVVGTDGSKAGRAAVDATVAFPWPKGTRVTAVVARGGEAARQLSATLSIALDAAVRDAADDAARRLQKRWRERDVDVVISEREPVSAVLQAARRADVVVLGSRGDSALGANVLGGVARAVVHGTKSAVLIVKGKRSAFQRLVVGFDGSAHARNAVAFVANLSPPPRGSVTLLSIVEPVRLASVGLLPDTARKLLLSEAKGMQDEALAAARRQLTAAAKPLAAAGWSVRIEVRLGTPVRDLVAAALRPRADLLVLGARGVGGLERLLVGSVAAATLDRAPMSVLVVR